jgi:hypothetical protein
MHLHDFQNFGIRGFSVNGFTLTNSTIDATASASAKNGTTDAADEDSMKFGTDDGSSNGVTGTLTITNSTISDGFENNFEIYNHTGSLTFTVSGSTFSKTSTVGPGNGGFRIQTDGSANVTGTITTSTFDQNRSRGIDLIQQGSGNMDIDIGQAGVAGSGGTFSDNGISVDIVQNGSGTLNFNVLNGTFTSANYATIFGAGGAGSAINIDRGGAASVVARGAFTGNIDNNNINNSDSGTGPGISVDINGTDNTGAANTFKLDGNTITHVQNFGILVATGDGNGLLNATITNNNVTTTLAGGLEAIRVNGGKTSSQAGSPGTPDNGTLNFDIHGNTVLASAAGGTTDIRVRQRFNVTDKIEGYGGSATDDAAVAAYLAGLNTHSGGGSATVSADHASTGFGTIAAVTEPPAPLLAFNGGVAAQTPTAGEMSLSAAELAAAVAAGMEYWAAAGLSPAQLATLQQVSYSIGDAPAGWLSASTAGHIAMSADGAGHGWFIDPTPFDSSEFANALSGTQLMANAADAPAGHMDLLTAVVHEMGQQLGLSDLTVPEERGDVMYVGLTDGERRLPSASDVNDINQNAIIDSATAAEAQLPDSASAGTGTIIVPGTPNDDTFHISQGSVIVAGGAGADTFIFEQAPTASIPHIADYSALEGDIIDVSAIASLPPLAAAPGAAPGPGASAVAMVRVAEDASGAFAALEVNSAGQWTEVAQLDGVHAGDAVTVIDATHQHQQVHAAWLA